VRDCNGIANKKGAVAAGFLQMVLKHGLFYLLAKHCSLLAILPTQILTIFDTTGINRCTPAVGKIYKFLHFRHLGVIWGSMHVHAMEVK